MRLQRERGHAHVVGTADELNEALEVAVEHTREAQDAFVDEPPGTPRAAELADDVEQRAEDVDVLASEVRVTTEEEAGPNAAQ